MNSGGGGSIVGTIIYLAIIALMLAGMWKVFEKAGKPGWAAIIPIYNLIVLLDIVGKPIWWLVLLLIPIVNLVILIIISMEWPFALVKARAGDSDYWSSCPLSGILCSVSVPTNILHRLSLHSRRKTACAAGTRHVLF